MKSSLHPFPHRNEEPPTPANGAYPANSSHLAVDFGLSTVNSRTAPQRHRFQQFTHSFLSRRGYTAKPQIRRNSISLTPFRINPSKSASKQRTLSSFRINTYGKQGGGGAERSRSLRCGPFEAQDERDDTKEKEGWRPEGTPLHRRCYTPTAAQEREEAGIRGGRMNSAPTTAKNQARG
jgi:hypothetical protein